MLSLIAVFMSSLVVFVAGLFTAVIAIKEIRGYDNQAIRSADLRFYLKGMGVLFALVVLLCPLM